MDKLSPTPEQISSLTRAGGSQYFGRFSRVVDPGARKVVLPISAIDAISPAFQHTKEQLFRPFRAGQWAKLAFVGLLAGELTTGSCGNFSGNYHAPRNPNHFIAPALPNLDPVLLVVLVVLLLLLGFVFWFALLYISSVMRFVLFDSVISKKCEIQNGWNRRQGPALHYFIWQIVFALAMGLGLIILLGIPAAIAFAAGWLTNPKQHLAPLILLGIMVFLAVFAFLVLLAVVHVLTKDFVIPQMALEKLSAFQAWSRLLRKLSAERGAYVGYVVMKIVLTLGVGIILGIITTLVVLIVLIPVGGIGAVIVFAGKTAGLGWNLYTITVAVVVGCILLAIILYVVSFISVPAMVFFPAYAIYFFAPRYPALEAILHPAPPPPLLPPLPAVIE